jgi:hypothetical protein
MLVKGHGQLAGFFKRDLSAGYSGTGRLNLKWSERGNPLLLLARKLFRCHLIEMAGFA